MNPWAILGVVLALGAAYGTGHYRGDKAGQAKIQAEWDQEKAKQYAEHAKRQEEARQREQQLQEASNILRQEKDREIRNLNARATALTNSLRDRPSRPSAVAGELSEAPGPGSAAAGCTGKNLYRETAEDLVRIAQDADQLRIALKQCYAQYQSIRQ